MIPPPPFQYLLLSVFSPAQGVLLCLLTLLLFVAFLSLILLGLEELGAFSGLGDWLIAGVAAVPVREGKEEEIMSTLGEYFPLYCTSLTKKQSYKDKREGEIKGEARGIVSASFLLLLRATHMLSTAESLFLLTSPTAAAPVLIPPSAVYRF